MAAHIATLFLLGKVSQWNIVLWYNNDIFTRPHWMNKSIWLEMAITTTKNSRAKKRAQSNVRRLWEATFLMGPGGLVFSEGFFSLIPIFLRFLLHSSPLPVFWDGRQFPHYLNSLTPPFPLYVLSDLSVKLFLCWAAVCRQLHQNTEYKLCLMWISHS